MKRNIKHPSTSDNNSLASITHPHFIILTLYGLIAVITPNLGAYDSNGPKFLAISLLNLSCLIYLLARNTRNSNDILNRFFKHKIGFVYTLIVLISGLSIIKAINPTETIIHLSKLLTVFTATYIITVILLEKKISLQYFVLGMLGLLLYDTIHVYKDIYNYIEGNISNLSKIKAGYSNKNVLAAAIFIKLPFALWLFTFKRKWFQKFGLLVFSLGSIALFFMNSRAFYLGFISLSVLYSLYLLLNFNRNGKYISIKKTGTFISAIAISFLIFSVVEQNFFVNKKSIKAGNMVVESLSTVTNEDGGGGRLQMWNYTLDLIKENPILGVGAGNWKIAILEKENQIRSNFTLFLHNHNDFLQIPAEIGIVGGICFILLFVLIFYYFIKATKHRDLKELELFFLPAFGLLCYSFDSFFNFPYDRPEIQALFAIYIGLGIAYSFDISQLKSPIKTTSFKFSNLTPLVFSFIGIATIVILYFNFHSLKTQNLIVAAKKGNFEVTSSQLIEEFPPVPNIGSVGDPINGLIAAQLNKEEKYKSALQYLNEENPSPFDSRIEFYKSISFYNLKEIDSAIYYIEKARKLKPLYFLYTKHLSNILESQDKNQQALQVLDSFLAKRPKVKEAWLYKAAIVSKMNEPAKASKIIDSALYFFPQDQKFLKVKEDYLINHYMPGYKNAIISYNKEEYDKAINYFQESLEGYHKIGGYEKFPDFLNSFARSHLNLNNISKSKKLFKNVLQEDPTNYYALHNLGFIAFNYDQDYLKAIEYFEKCLNTDQPDYFSTYRNLGTLYLITNQADQSIKAYEESLKYGNSQTIYRNLYLLYKAKKKEDKMNYYRSKIKT
jgi:putative inorganic carbon (hco3(-)) transporter